jgi:hypothetical protein
VPLHAITMAWRAASTVQKVAIVTVLLVTILLMPFIVSKMGGSQVQPTAAPSVVASRGA